MTDDRDEDGDQAEETSTATREESRDGEAAKEKKPPLFSLGALRRRRKQTDVNPQTEQEPPVAPTATADPVGYEPTAGEPAAFPLSDLRQKLKSAAERPSPPATETDANLNVSDHSGPPLFPNPAAPTDPFAINDEPTLFPEAAATPQPSRTPIESQVFGPPPPEDTLATPDPSSVMVFHGQKSPASPPATETKRATVSPPDTPNDSGDDAKTDRQRRGDRIYGRSSEDDVLVEMPGTKFPGPEQSTPRLVTENTGLSANGLGKRFKQRQVLRGVSLSVQRGEVVGLLGPNGAGKTTCFYIITGLISADYGTITLDNQDITTLPMYRRARLGIGYLPQEPSVFRGMTVEQNIRAVLESVESEPDAREAMLDDLMAEFSITHLRRTPALALSGGERRRLEIARALASQPHFILLDEPLAGIDPIALGDIRDLVSHLKDRGIGVLITDHNVRETLDIVDRAYIIHNGEVLMSGNPSDIVRHDDVRRVYLGDGFRL